jgi:hypothetical protein
VTEANAVPASRPFVIGLFSTTCLVLCFELLFSCEQHGPADEQDGTFLEAAIACASS